VILAVFTKWGFCAIVQTTGRGETHGGVRSRRTSNLLIAKCCRREWLAKTIDDVLEERK